MKTHKNLYYKIYKWKNLVFAFKKSKKEKTKKHYVIKFWEDLPDSLLELQYELKTQTYRPRSLKTFILRDPKTRKISKSDFRDRIIHHALCNIIEPIFQKSFIHDSCANQKHKGNLFAIKRFYQFKRKVSRNGKINGWFNNNQIKGYCLKADIKHYFQKVNHQILLKIIKRKITDEKLIWLIKQILNSSTNLGGERREQQIIGMPLGNLTSQFFANVYLNELDCFVKQKLKARYYIRYVDDFMILHRSRRQLKIWKSEINSFLFKKLKLELHREKSKIIPLSRGVDFVGFRNFYYFKLLRKRNIENMKRKINLFLKNKISSIKFIEIYQGWKAHASWADTHNLTKSILIQNSKN